MRKIQMTWVVVFVAGVISWSEAAHAGRRLPICLQYARSSAPATLSGPAQVGLNRVALTTEYTLPAGMTLTRLNVEEETTSESFVASSKFTNSFLGGNNPSHEAEAYGNVQNGYPVIAVSVAANPSETRIGSFRVVEGDWTTAPTGWSLVDSVMKSFTVGEVQSAAIPISGLKARFGAFMAGNNPEYDFQRSVKYSKQIRYFYLWVKYESK